MMIPEKGRRENPIRFSSLTLNDAFRGYRYQRISPDDTSDVLRSGIKRCVALFSIITSGSAYFTEQISAVKHC